MIKNIFHTGDWHLRNFDRHLEFQESIELFLFEIVKYDLPYEKGLIVVTGDLFDNHEQISNEANLIMVQTLKKCLEVHPVLINIGNHDLPKNRTRLDAITPIVTAINHPDLKYTKNSEIFKFNGINFVHYSFLDNFAISCPSDKDGLHIGLYHAPIQNCKQPLDWMFEKKMEDYSVNVNIFANCDIVLMGDIHYPQKIKGDGYNAYYCGSLYQQNFGEYVNKHGFGVLEIETLEYKFVEMQNSFGKYKFKIKNIDDIINQTVTILNIEK